VPCRHGRGRRGAALRDRSLARAARRAAAVLSLVAATAGCTFRVAPYLPPTWQGSAATLPELADDAARGPRLQVLVAYGGLMASHTALRLVPAEGPVVFWDPAGDYGREGVGLDPRWGPYDEHVTRRRDLIVSAPDLGTYLRFRWGLLDTGVEVFEWDLPAAHAEELRRVLLEGTGRAHPAGAFSTLAPMAFCTVATADFLGRFASPTRGLRGFYFFPDALARQLYGRSPSRVLLFRPELAPEVYVPPR
jgi:hypothetical protein